MKRRSVVFLGFFSGIALGTGYRLGLALPLGLAALGLIFWLFTFLRRDQNYRLIPLIAIFCLAAGLGALRGTASLGPVTRPLDHLVGQKIELTGTIIDEPDERETGTKLTVQPDDGGDQILLNVGRYPTWSYGSRLSFKGILERPKNFQTDSGKEFDYQHYLAKDDIYYLINQPTVQSRPDAGSWLVVTRRALFDVKNSFLDKLAVVLPEPQNALLGGIVVGAKRALPALWQDRFRAAGLSHLVVLSGYNITIAAEAAARLFSFLPALVGLSAGAASVLLFTLAAGASTTAVRAALMALLAILARASGRLYQALDALFLVAIVMMLWQPKILLFDISFQLSFLATLGVIAGPPLLEKYFQWLPEKFGLRETAKTTLSAQLLVLPLIIFQMGQLSLFGLPANLLVLPLVPVTMLLGVLVGGLGFVSHGLSLLIALPLGWLLAYILLVVKIFASLPFASLAITYFPLWLMALIYLAYFFWWQKHKI